MIPELLDLVHVWEHARRRGTPEQVEAAKKSILRHYSHGQYQVTMPNGWRRLLRVDSETKNVRFPAVHEGEIQYTSPSQIVTADHDSYGGCLTRWGYDKIEGRSEETTSAQQAGIDGHARIERYQLTGEMVLEQAELRGKHFIPEPRSGALMEQAIHEDRHQLSVGGVPLVGYLDLLNDGPTWIDPMGVEQPQEDTLEVLDWKFTGAIRKAAKRPDTIPMWAYGLWALNRQSRVERARLSHVYFPTRGNDTPIKLTLVRDVDTLERNWRSVEKVFARMVDVAKDFDPRKTPKNQKSCTAWRGCPHAAYCPRDLGGTLASYFGTTGAKQMLDFDDILEPDVAAELKLLEEDDGVPAEFAEAVDYLKSIPYGMPALGGEAAKLYGAHTGVASSGPFAGSGKLGEKCSQIDDADTFIKMVGSVRAHVEKSAPPANTPANTPALQDAPQASTPALVQPNAPKSDPAKAAVPIETPPTDAPAAGAGTGASSPPPATPLAPAGAPDLDVDVKKLKAKEAREYAAQLQDELRKAPDAIVVPSVPAPAPGLVVYVNAIPSCAFESLDSYVTAACAKIAEHQEVPDIRIAANDKAIGYGKWRGALAALVREGPPSPGVYFLDTRGRDLAEVVAEALTDVADLVVRGIR